MSLLSAMMVLLNPNQWGIFRHFGEKKSHEEHPKQEDTLVMSDPYEPNLFT